MTSISSAELPVAAPESQNFFSRALNRAKGYTSLPSQAPFSPASAVQHASSRYAPSTFNLSPSQLVAEQGFRSLPRTMTVVDERTQKSGDSKVYIATELQGQKFVSHGFNSVAEAMLHAPAGKDTAVTFIKRNEDGSGRSAGAKVSQVGRLKAFAYQQKGARTFGADNVGDVAFKEINTANRHNAQSAQNVDKAFRDYAPQFSTFMPENYLNTQAVTPTRTSRVMDKMGLPKILHALQNRA